jgi:hypothetical protein
MSRSAAEIRPFDPADIDAVAGNIREADRRELEAWTGCSDLLPDLMASIEMSDRVWTGVLEGQPACLFGVAPGSILGAVGTPWLVSTPAIDRHPIAFLRACQPALRRMQSDYYVLRNFVDVRNTRVKRWLTWLGFELQEPVPFGPWGLPFHPFEWRSRCAW